MKKLFLLFMLFFLLLSCKQNNSQIAQKSGNLDSSLSVGRKQIEIVFKPIIDSHIKRMIFNINYPWLQTNITFKKDTTYYIVVSGLASTSLRKLSLWTGPEGGNPTSYKIKNFAADSLPPFSVIGKLGNNGKIFYIGKEIELTPSESVDVYFGYNDNLFTDNIGYYVIDIFSDKKENVLKKLGKAKNKIGVFYGE